MSPRAGFAAVAYVPAWRTTPWLRAGRFSLPPDRLGTAHLRTLDVTAFAREA